MEWRMTLLHERMKGRKEGESRGILIEQIDIIEKKIKKGFGLPEIADAMEKEAEEIRPVWEAVKAAAPEYDTEQILGMLLAGGK